MQNLISTIECKNAAMKTTDRWTLKQKSPKPSNKLNILTEADVLQRINNKKNIEGGGGGTNMNMNFGNSQSNIFDMMKMQNPFMSMNNNGMFMQQG